MQNRAGAKLIIALILLSFLGGFQGLAQNSNSQLEHISTTRLPKGDPLMGGISAVEIYDQGRSAILLSDRGAWTSGQIERDNDGRITGVKLAPMQPLRDSKGKPLERPFTDSEGIALGKDGSLFVSFEGQTRIAKYAGPDQPAQSIKGPEAFKNMGINSGLEALAIDDKGRLFTLPEEPKTEHFPIYILDKGKWSQPFDLPRRGEFLPVGADFGPDGRFYLLERAFYGLGGFASRIRVFDLSTKGITSEQTLLTTGRGEYDNLEGISVWKDPQGSIRISLVSDNNFLFLLRHQIVEYRVKGH